MTSLPTSMRALVFHTPGDASVQTIPIPSLREGYMLVRTHSVALDPTNWKRLAWAQGAAPWRIVGCDFSGVVVGVGDQDEKEIEENGSDERRWRVGDEVFGVVHGCNESQGVDGAFAEFVAVKRGLAMRKLDEEGLGAVTVGYGLFLKGEERSLGLMLPGADAAGSGGENEFILIVAALRRGAWVYSLLGWLGGYRVVVTCSPSNEAFVKGRVGDEVVDYNLSDCAARIRKVMGNQLRFVCDAVGEWELCRQALGDVAAVEGGRFHGTILGNEIEIRDEWRGLGENIAVIGTSVYAVFGEAYRKYGEDVLARNEEYGFGRRWVGLVEGLVRDGRLRPHPVIVRRVVWMGSCSG